MLMVKQLNMVTTLRMVLGIVGGIVLPLVMLQETVLTAEAGFQPLFGSACPTGACMDAADCAPAVSILAQTPNAVGDSGGQKGGINDGNNGGPW